MVAAPLRCFGDRNGQGAAARRRLDDLVDHADLDRTRQSAGEDLALGGELVLDLRPVPFGDLSETSTMQDAHGRDTTHDCDGRRRPCEYLCRYGVIRLVDPGLRCGYGLIGWELGIRAVMRSFE